MAQPGRQAARAYYESVRRAFKRASREAGEFEQRLQIGEVRVKLRFAGPGLSAVLLPAFSPVLQSGSGPNDFEVELWDEATTGVGIPPPPWSLRDVIARGDIRTLSGGRIRAHVARGHRVLTMWDCERRRGIMWAADAHRLPYWLRAAPLRLVLHWGLSSPRRHLLHAGAVGDERSGALLVGPNGSGKSTTSLACVRGGLGYAGDDCVLLETEPSPRAISVYGTAKLSAPSVNLLPGLPARRPSPDDESKFIVDVARAWPRLMQRSVAISVVLLPQVTAGRVLLRPASAAQAFRALAPSTVLQHADESATGLALMSRLVRQIPAYTLELGSDIAAVGPAIRHLLEVSL
ncbi:MAG TPA: hypothetical protein VGL51_10580 [Solirubrobacteraceae bacterium]